MCGWNLVADSQRHKPPEAQGSALLFQTGLIVACYHGYVDVVIALSQCPYLDVNWQDNEGNTALMTAAQAGEHTPPVKETNEPMLQPRVWRSTGHVLISSYLLNYFPGLDVERRNCHGFTALMKAAVQGRAECVRAIMLAGKAPRRRTTHLHPGIVPWQDECPLGSFLTSILFHKEGIFKPGTTAAA